MVMVNLNTKLEEQKRKLVKILLEYERNPVLFVQEMFEVEPTHQQKKILRAIAPPGAHVTVRSGHGIGKTSVEAWVVLWGLLLHTDIKIPCTAPTSHQLNDLLWSEIAKWAERMPRSFRPLVRWTSDHVMMVGSEETRFAVARTARAEKPEALQGFHGSNLIFLIDESSGIHEKIFEVAEGALSTRNARVLMCSNPTRTDGYFYRSHTTDKEDWTCLNFSSMNSPLVDPKFPVRMAKRYGEDSSIFKVRVLGEFPESSDDTLIPLAWITDAIDRDVEFPFSPRIAGLDVARFGDDDNGLIIRQGSKVTYIDRWRNADLMNTCGKIVTAYRDEKLFDRINVDVIGMGAGVVDRLQELKVPAVGINVAESSSMKPKFNRLRDELWWNCREWFQDRACCLPHTLPKIYLDDLIGELSSIRYNYTSAGKIRVEGKADMKKRGLDSPNLADALNLTFAEGISMKKIRHGKHKVVNAPMGGWV